MDRKKRSRAEAHPHRNDITKELLPDIVFLNILPRLPVKSVGRFTCVSKQWHSFLTTPEFVKTHRQHVITNKMVVVSAATKWFHTIDCERPKEGFSAGRPFPFKVGPSQNIRILTSVHGLVCIGVKTKPIRRGRYFGWGKYSDLILWNPATGDHKTLSKPLARYYDDCYTTGESLFGLYHSSWDDDYKLLRVTPHPNVYIYSLKSDSWRKVESDLQRIRASPFSLSFFWGPSISLNEKLYFLEYDFNKSYSIMKFNTEAETLKLIATPFLQNRTTTWLSFTVLRDCVHLWVNIADSLTFTSENELWRMDGDRNWTKVVSTGLIFSSKIQLSHRLHLMRNGNMLIYHGACVYELDMKTHTIVLSSNANENMLVSPGGKYIETLVSPNQYIM
ncbi:hypothetical protein L1887_38894 [Cichorium endivia]|nr:hypothetical protein L1887_38894 [Cichorium endivia]